MSSPEPTGAPKRSPLFGVSKTRVKSLDDGVRKTIENALARWTEKRIEFIQSLPEATQAELDSEGMLQAPTISIPNGKPAPAAPLARPTHVPQTGLAGATYIPRNQR